MNGSGPDWVIVRRRCGRYYDFPTPLSGQSGAQVRKSESYGPCLHYFLREGVSHHSLTIAPILIVWLWGSAVNNTARKRMIGIAVAWLAAYALILNVILVSVLHAAALSPGALAAGQLVCSSSTALNVAHDNSGKNDKRTSVHCPLCTGNHSAAALPPPPISVVLEREPSQTQLVIASDYVFIALARFFHNLARGPLSLI